MFDTHCHLNFQAFEGRVEEVIDKAKKSDIDIIIVPGTDVETSKKAVEIAKKFSNIYAAVGIHPHHVFEILNKKSTIVNRESRIGLEDRSSKVEKNQPSTFYHRYLFSILNRLSFLLFHPKVVAIGEVGIDRHLYQKTKHENYKVDEEFVDLQKEFFIKQIKLAHKYKKAIIIHNREAKKDILKILTDYRSQINDYRSVFHCCEPDMELLQFAKLHKMFIGVDGDVFYRKEKQEFIKKVPLDMLVLETDSPFLSPYRKFPNEPKNILFIAEFIAKLKGVSLKNIEKQTTANAKILFGISQD